MLINNIKALTFKPINFKFKKSPLIKTNYFDVFEKSSTCSALNSISFKENYRGYPNVPRKKKIELQNFIKTRNFSDDMEGACACFALNLTNNQTYQYRVIRNKYPERNKMSIALCAKANLDDEQKEQYISLITKPIKYTDDNNEEQEWQIPADEAILCVKENFNEDQLERYAQLRNRVVDLREKSVRGMGKTHNFRPQYVLDAVKEDKEDEQIEQETLFYKGLIQYGLDVGDALLYARLNKEETEKYDAAREKGLEHIEAIAHIMLNAQQLEAYYEALDKYSKYAEKLSQEMLDLKKINSYTGILGTYLGADAAISISELYKKQIKSLDLKTKKNYIKYMEHALAIYYASLNQEQREVFDEAIEKNIGLAEMPLYLFLNSEKREEYCKVKESGLNEVDIYSYVLLSPEDKEAYNKATGNGFNCHNALKYAMLSEEGRKTCDEMLKEGYEYEKALAHAMLKPDERVVYDEAREKGANFNEALLCTAMNSKEREAYLKLKNENFGQFEGLLCLCLSDEEREVYEEAKNKGLNPIIAFSYTYGLNSQQRKIFLSLIEQNYDPAEAINLAFAGVKSCTPEILEQIPDNVWYNIQTGATKEIHDTIQAAIKLCLNPPVDIKKIKPVDVKDLELKSKLNKNGILKHNNGQFSVEIQKAEANNQPILIVKDQRAKKDGNSDTFVAYRGAIAYVTPLALIDEQKKEVLQTLEQEMKPHCNILPEKQAPILAKAIKEFIFDITDENKGCIISKGLEGIIQAENGITQDDLKPYKGSDKTLDETKDHFLKLVNALDGQGQLNAKNLLRIFPEDSMLSINPYTIKTDNSNVLYSISCEWKDKENVLWEMRIHSAHLSDANAAKTADKWVFRLGYRIINKNANIRRFLQKTSEAAGYDFSGGFKTEDSHIKFDSPIDSKNLLNNMDFQKDIRSISLALYEEDKINTVCTEINTTDAQELNRMNYYEKAKIVIDYAIKNPIFYYENQNYIDELRATLKLPDLKNIA